MLTYDVGAFDPSATYAADGFSGIWNRMIGIGVVYGEVKTRLTTINVLSKRHTRVDFGYLIFASMKHRGRDQFGKGPTRDLAVPFACSIHDGMQMRGRYYL